MKMRVLAGMATASAVFCMSLPVAMADGPQKKGKKVVVQQILNDKKEQVPALLVFERTSEISSQYRGFTARELIELAQSDSRLKTAIAEIAEVDEEDLIGVLKAFKPDQELRLTLKDPTKLAIAAAKINRTPQYSLDESPTASTPDPVTSPSTTNEPEEEGTGALGEVAAADRKHIDERKLKEILDAKKTDLKGDAARSEDIKNLYDALAILASDKRCGIVRIKTKQLYLTKGIAIRQPTVDIDASSNDIGGGSIEVFMGEGDPVILSWDAEHFTKMGVKDWLYGHPNGASNGHTGFYEQLASRGLCGMKKEEEKEKPDQSVALAGVRPQEAKHVDKDRLKGILDAKATDLKGDAANNKDIQSLYDALAIVASDKRCGITRIKSKQDYLTRGFVLRQPTIDIDASSNDIGGGRLEVFRGDDAEPVILSWDANHLTEMGVSDWLYGHPTANGHVGLYRQLAQKGLCKMGSGAEMGDDAGNEQPDNRTHRP